MSYHLFTKCYIIRPRNVASIVHEMSSTQKQWFLSCIGWLPLEFVQDSYHWDMYRLVTIGICIGWLPQGIVYRLVTIVYDLVTSGICIGWLPLGFVQVGYHCNLYSIFSSVYRLVLGSVLGYIYQSSSKIVGFPQTSNQLKRTNH